MSGWILLIGMLTFGPLTWWCIYLLQKVFKDDTPCLPLIVIPIAIYLALMLGDYVIKHPEFFGR